MKRVLFFFFASFIAFNAYSQDLVYRAFGVEQQEQQQQSQTVRTTAYAQNSNGSYTKMPIRVEVSQTSYGATTMKVVAAYVSNGYSGSWQKVPANRVEECRPIYASSGNQLESQFMYKSLLTVGGVRTWYCDL